MRFSNLPPCVVDGIAGGLVAGVLGGAPSMLLLTWEDVDQSIRAIAHLVPGNERIGSAWGRRALGATTHMGISLALATLYTCSVNKRPLAYGAALWTVNIKLLAPEEMRRQDRSYALADHLSWALVVHATSRLRERWHNCG
jgi:hypothetical protein